MFLNELYYLEDVLGSPDAISFLNQQVPTLIQSDFSTGMDTMLGKQREVSEYEKKGKGKGKVDELKLLFNLRDTNRYSEISSLVHNAKNIRELLHRLSFLHGIVGGISSQHA